MAGLDVSKRQLATKIARWRKNPYDPERKLLERIGGSIFGPTDAEWWYWKDTQQPATKEFVIVTSFAPGVSHYAKQTRALRSWVRLGVQVIAVCTSTEEPGIRDLYPQCRTLVCDDVGDAYRRPTQRINSLLGVASILNKPVLLINSDIEIYGHRCALESGDVTVGIRHNYLKTPGDRRREQFGFDAFFLTPEATKTLPQMAYSIGRPFWDYWLVFHLLGLGMNIQWIGEPFFYHEAHPVQWSVTDWRRGLEWLGEQYGRMHLETNWEKWRKSLPFPPE